MAQPTPDLRDRASGDNIPRFLTSIRWRIGLCGFFAIFLATAFRLNFTVGVSCMVDLPSSHPPEGVVPNQTIYFFSGAGLEGPGYISSKENQSKTQIFNSTLYQNSEFDWSKQTQALLLSAFSYGYLLLQVPGGWLSRRFGSRLVIGISMFAAMLFTALTPICARTHIYLLFAIRIALGAVTSVSYPAIFSLAVRWIPHKELTRFLVFAIAGFPIGRVVTFPVSGVLCEYGFDDGWGSIFYVSAIAGVVLLIAWFYVVYDSPLQHPRISPAEKEYILARVGRLESKTERRQITPWLNILTSAPFWGTAIAHFAVDWTNNTLQLGLILYMREALEFKITSSGALSALPFIAMFITSILVGFLSDCILGRKLLSRVNTRRLFQTLSLVPMGILMGAIGFIGKDKAEWAVVCLVLSQTFFGFSRGGFVVSVMDYAPRYSAEISGMSNLVGTTTGLLVPLAIGNLTPNGTQEEWRNIFLIGGGIPILASVGFCVFSRGEIQPWARFALEDEPEIEIMVNGISPKAEERTEKI